MSYFRGLVCVPFLCFVEFERGPDSYASLELKKLQWPDYREWNSSNIKLSPELNYGYKVVIDSIPVLIQYIWKQIFSPCNMHD